MHDWDIRSGLEPKAHLSPAVLPVILGTVADSLASGSLRWAFWPGEKLAQPVHYRFVLTDTDVTLPDVVVEGDSVRLAPAGKGHADVTLQGDAETYVLCLYGRLPMADAMASGRLRVTGDQALATALSQWFKGI
jgi:predicted lipid carrier protein YhbT